MQHQLPCIVVIYWISACILGVCWWGEEKFKIQEPESPRILWGPYETPWLRQGFPSDRRNFVNATSFYNSIKTKEPESPGILLGPSETPWFALGFPPDRRHFAYATSATLYFSHLLNNWLHWGVADGVKACFHRITRKDVASCKKIGKNSEASK